MFSLYLVSLLVATSQAATQLAPKLRREGNLLETRGKEPAYETDEDASGDCTFWYDSAAKLECNSLVIAFSISVEELVTWNPSLASSCELQPDHSYCVEAPSASNPGPSQSESPSPTEDDDDDETPTSTDDEIHTPLPTQEGMVDDCDAFYLVEPGDSCNVIASDNGVTVTDLVTWNPAIGSACTTMWAGYYLCVSTIGQEGDQSTGMPTPTPTQPGMVDNCDEFHLVEEGEACYSIADEYDISLDDFLTWNPKAGGGACTSLWLDAYACVGIID